MNPNVKRKWVAALRSGEYAQAQGQLRDGNLYCCLGVLCDLHARETGSKWTTVMGEFHYMGNSKVLPSKVMEWAGLLRDIGATVVIDMVRSSLADHNDDGDCTFAEIADAIEKQL